jgi:hypothetical protein
VRRLAGTLLLALAGCAGTTPLEQARLAAPPEIASCAQWFEALDRETAAAGVRDLEYTAVPGFPYLRGDDFLARSAARAARSAAAFDALAARLLEHDREARGYEIDNLPAAAVEKWSGMRLDDSRSAALRRSVQCGQLLRDTELVQPELRAALLARLTLGAAPAPRRACPAFAGGAGARVRFAPPPAAASRPEVRGWLLRGEVDPLGQPLVSARELEAMAAAYAPSVEVAVAADADRFGTLRWRRGAAAPEVDPAQPAVYVGRSYARYEGQALLQLVYTLAFPANRITWRVTLAPDGEPLVYDAVGADGCQATVLTPRARLRKGAAAELPRAREDARALLAISAGTHEVRALGLVRGSDSLARYSLRSYDELRSSPTLEGRNRAAAGRPALASGEPLEARLVLDLAEPRP